MDDDLAVAGAGWDMQTQELVGGFRWVWAATQANDTAMFWSLCRSGWVVSQLALLVAGRVDVRIP